MSETRQIHLPAMSATMEEATLLRWLVSPGDEVSQGAPVAEISTDKVDMELESPYSGTIQELLVEEGAEVAVGAVLATMTTDSDDLLGGLSFDSGGPESEPEPQPEPETDSVSVEESEPEQSTIVAASPPARVLARKLGVDLREVTPTGRRGQVTPADVEAFARARDAEAAPAEEPAAAPAPEPAPRPVAAPAPTPEAEAPPAAAPSEVDPRRLSTRKATAEIMLRSAAIPQFTLYRTLYLDRAAERRSGRSWTTELVRAMAAASRQHPELNGRWDEESATVIQGEAVAVGLAVDRPGVGLVVATISDPDLMAPDEADQAIRALVDRARAGKLRPDDLGQASITLSNLGGIGVDRFNALLFPPQPAIMSAGTIRRRPAVTGDGGLVAALTCEVGLTVDHRVADGADGARFLDTFAGLVEGRL